MSKTLAEILAANAKSMRLKRQLTQEDVIQRSGLSRQTLLRLESGTVNVGIDKVQALSRVYRCSIDKLLSDPKAESPEDYESANKRAFKMALDLMEEHSHYNNETNDCWFRRYQNQSTYFNQNEITQVLRNEGLQKIVFFATAKTPKDDYSENSDGPAVNLPLMAAVADVKFPALGFVSIVFDGLFLHAARLPRYHEVRTVLDEATKCNKAFYCESRAPFTSRLPAKAAILMLRELGPISALNHVSRCEYFNLLSDQSEDHLHSSE